MTIGDRIKELREKKNISLEKVGNYLGVSRQTIQKYESNVITNIRSDNIEKLAVILETTPMYLMGWEDLKKEKEGVPNIFHLSKDNDGTIQKYAPEEVERAQMDMYLLKRYPSDAVQLIHEFLEFMDHKYNIK